VTVIAHSGHWAAQLIYLAPIALLAVGLGVQKMRDKRLGSHRDLEDEEQ
jgi:hypothetical protein